MNPFGTISVIAALGFAATACNTTGCTDNQNSVPLAGFYSYATFEPVSLDSVEVGGVGAPADSLLLKPEGYGVQQVYMPFRATAGKTSFYIRYKQKELDDERFNDTLKFEYEAIPYFASEECGAMYHYRIRRLDYTRHLIDSIGLTDSLITNVERETVQIYFHTIEPDEPDENL